MIIVNGTRRNNKDCLYFRTVIHRTKEEEKEESRVSTKKTHRRNTGI